MKPRHMRSLHSFQPPAVVTPAKPKATPPKTVTIGENTKVVLTQGILYRTLGGKTNLIRPGHKLIPPGSLGTVQAVINGGKSFQVQFIKPVPGTVTVNAQEVTIWQGTARA